VKTIISYPTVPIIKAYQIFVKKSADALSLELCTLVAWFYYYKGFHAQMIFWAYSQRVGFSFIHYEDCWTVTLLLLYILWREVNRSHWNRGIRFRGLIETAGSELCKRLSRRKRSHMQNGFRPWIRALGGIVWWKNRGSKISWHCPFKCNSRFY
jgi:hypothetical protein